MEIPISAVYIMITLAMIKYTPISCHGDDKHGY